MEILCQPVLNTIGNWDLPVPSVRMAQLFYEFLGRYKEWKIAQRHRTIGRLILLYLGFSSLLLFCFLPGGRVIMMMVMSMLFYFATRHYLEVNERLNHVYVNVHILHHHIIGKLEVGFCDHSEPCQCVDNFRHYALTKHGISFSNGSFR